MNKIAITIGVNIVEGFTPLSGAVLGAQQFAKWASSHDYEVKIFIDNNGNKVKASDIFDLISSCIDSKKYSQLIVYFSGHGISRGPNQEFWLLSDAGKDPNAFINLTSSSDNAGTCSIPYVLFISDACRSLPDRLSHAATGQTIFPIINDNSYSVVDIFYGTRPGAPAYEVKNTDTISHGVFTESLIDFLEGGYPDAIANYENTHKRNYLSQYYDRIKLNIDINYKSLPKPDSQWIISAVEADTILQRLVEEKAFKIQKDQSPEIRVRNHKTTYPLSQFSDLEGKKIILGPQGGMKSNTDPIIPILPTPDQVSSYSKIMDFTQNLWMEKDNTKFVKEQIEDNKEGLFISELLFSDSKENSDLNILTGFIVRGVSVAEIIINGKIIKITSDSPVIDLSESDDASVLLILQNGMSVPLPVLKGFIGSSIFRDNYLFTISYTPSIYNPHNYFEYQVKKEMIESKRNYIAIAANNGFSYDKAFQEMNFSDLEFDSIGNFLRIGKSIDPSLGLYAAYAFRETGEIKKIKSVYRYMKRDNPKVLFDVAMLAGKLTTELRTAIFCPLMSAGWSYNHLYKEVIKEEVLEAAKYLKPGLWTTFEKQGTEIIKEALLKKIII